VHKHFDAHIIKGNTPGGLQGDFAYGMKGEQGAQHIKGDCCSRDVVNGQGCISGGVSMKGEGGEGHRVAFDHNDSVET
jgi:hypothetical protein